jgi:hypothetical protein
MEGFAGQKNKTPLAIILTVGVAIILALAGFMAQGVIIVIVALIYQAILQYGRRVVRTTVVAATTRDIIRLAIFIIPLISALINGLWLVAGGIFIALLINLFLN